MVAAFAALRALIQEFFHPAIMSNAAENRLAFEIMKIERLRLIIICAIGTIATLQAFTVEFLIPDSFRPLRSIFRNFSLVQWGLTMFVGTLYELLALFFVHQAITKRRRTPEIIRYISAFVETGFPTMLMLLQGPSIHPLYAAHTPFILAYSVFIILSTLHLRLMLGLFTGAVAGVGYFFICWQLLPHNEPVSIENYYYMSFSPAVAKAFLLLGSGIIAGVVGHLMRYILTNLIHSQEEKSSIIGMFGQYVSPHVVDELMEQKNEISGELQGKMNRVTVMFMDIRGFTTFAENRPPTEVVQYLNTLFGHLISIINEHNGVVNKFLGDGFMAVFGVPFSHKNDAFNAVQAALAITRKVEEINASGLLPTTTIGIGLHTGFVVTGSVGSEERKEYTIIGDTVNLASRVEQLTKDFSAQVLMTAAVYDETRSALIKQNFRCEELPPVQVKGRVEPVVIYKAL